MIKVLFFASLREKMGTGSTETDWRPSLTPAQLWEQATEQDELPDNVLIARNQEYCDPDTKLKDGDEVAFFPPVTGG